ncbi:ATP-binding protein [Pelagibius sp. CAU 1746]|uniref:ATP-binding protein n=1 Tax=Pelagibius sp. CAU 1746 TaxID=3140370 RepID=UPI00325A5417
MFAAFACILVFVGAAGGVAWWSYSTLGEYLRQVSEDTIPAFADATRLAERGSEVSAAATALSVAADDKERQGVWRRLEPALSDMRAILVQFQSLGGNTEVKALNALVDRVEATLLALDRNVQHRFFLAAENLEHVERLRWVHAAFLDEIEPIVSDARFNMDLAIRSSGDGPAADRQIIQREARRQELLLRIDAAGNLMVGLVGRASSAPDVAALDDTWRFAAEVVDQMKADLANLDSPASALSLRQTVIELLTYVDGDNSVFDLRRRQLTAMDDGISLVTRTFETIEQLQRETDINLAGVFQSARQMTERSESAIYQGQVMLILSAIAVTLISILVIWLYVGRRLVRRILELNESMKAIAGGDLSAPVPSGGADEITTMAQSLRTFRDTLSETQAELIQAGKLAALGQLAAGIAHELNQPLSAIQSYAHNAGTFLERGDTAEAQANLNHIQRLSRKASATVNHFKTLARKPASTVGTASVPTVVREALSILDNRISGEGVEVRLHLPDGDCLAQAGPIRLEQVLINVIGNALDAMKDSPRKILELSVQERGERVAMAIVDTGVGMTSEQSQHAFDPFYTTKQVGEGLGLGLTISYNIIKDFGGSMKALPMAAGGTRFEILLNKARQKGAAA